MFLMTKSRVSHCTFLTVQEADEIVHFFNFFETLNLQFYGPVHCLLIRESLFWKKTEMVMGTVL